MVERLDNKEPSRPMQLVAVATGKSREVKIQGPMIQTAYLKSSVEDYGGPAGNETAVHPDTVYAIAHEHYEYWAERLGTDPIPWVYGYFAENLTIRGLSEHALCVGDVLQIGSNVRLVAPAPGHALLCCSRPGSRVLVLDA